MKPLRILETTMPVRYIFGMKYHLVVLYYKNLHPGSKLTHPVFF
jgi:hypothetical protein